MLLVHATTTDHLSGIRKGGIQVRHHRLRRPAVWLADQKLAPWAVVHAMKRHGVGPADVVLVYVEVDRKHLKRFRWKGLYYHMADVPASAIRRVETFAVRVLEG